MSSTDSPQMQRSFSMPVQPEPLQEKPMKRSQEKEVLYEEDYYPESPSCERRRKSRIDNRDRLGSHSLSDNNIRSADWAGSTIELNNADLRRNELDAFYHRRKPYRVIEKNGRENVIFKRIPEKSWRYIRDFVTTLVRFILPKRFLMNTKPSSPPLTTSVVVTGTVNTAQTHDVTSSQLDELDKEDKTNGSEWKLLETTTTTDDKSEVKLFSDDKRQKDDRRVKFSLYD